jgi:SnoaL-like domain
METLIKHNSLLERITDLNNMILEGSILDAFEKYYANDVTMQENENPPTLGKANNRANEEAFVNGITEFRSAVVKNVIVSNNITVVEWDFDFTHKDWGTRTYTQVSVQRWNDEGQIINEKFNYNN